MLDDQIDGAPVVMPPYTHDMHAALARLAAQDRVVLVQYVQARSRGASYCCTIYRPWFAPDGSPLWSLNSLDGSHPFERVVVPVRNVRQCSGLDGRCVCAGELGAHVESPRSGLTAGATGSPAGEVTCK
jgi:hypothetical protein